jgi:hypothetical protein
MPDNVETTYAPTVYIYSLIEAVVGTRENDNIPGWYIAIVPEAHRKGENYEDFLLYPSQCRLA